MGWVFEELTRRYEDPFAANVLKVTSTELRPSYPAAISPKNLIKWDSSRFYTDNIKNSSFEFEFTRNTYVFTRYKLKGISTACSPYKWVVEGSLDHKKYATLAKVDRSLCNTRIISNECNETFPMTKKAKVKYIKVVNTGGECEGKNNYFGLTSADFFGDIYYSQRKVVKLKSYILLQLILIALS